MLSGGLDSSIITGVTSQYISKLSTYSVDYQDQDKYFQPYEYQTTRDDHYIDEVKTLYNTKHKTVTLSQKQLVMSLKESLIARDAPGMADIDSSFLLFSKKFLIIIKLYFPENVRMKFLVATHGFIEKNFTVLTAFHGCVI